MNYFTKYFLIGLGFICVGLAFILATMYDLHKVTTSVTKIIENDNGKKEK